MPDLPPVLSSCFGGIWREVKEAQPTAGEGGVLDDIWRTEERPGSQPEMCKWCKENSSSTQFSPKVL